MVAQGKPQPPAGLAGGEPGPAGSGGVESAGFEGRETGSGSILKTETNEYRTGALIAAWNSVKKFMTRWRNG